MRRRTLKRRGFSLIELLIASALLMVVTGTAFSLLIAFQKHYTSTAIKADMHAGVRNATELLEQEIGQAGLLSLTPTSLSAAVTGGAAAQTVPIASIAGMFVGEKVQIDLGTAEETVAITAIASSPTTITGIFENSHSAGAVVSATGVFPQGILSGSTATQLNMFGDINADGSLVFVQYNCDTVAGTLTRSITPIAAGAKNTAVILLENLRPNPGGTACFQYPATTSVTVSGSGTTYNFIPGVAVTLTTQTAELDPNTRQYATETKAFLDVAPRNVQEGITLATNGIDDFLQPNPPGNCLLLGTC